MAVQVVIASVLGALGRSLLDKLSYFLAMKALLISLMVLVLPIILKNAITWMIEIFHNTMASAVQGYSLEAQIIELSGIGAYLAQQMQLPLCLSIILTALSIRLVLNFIPLVG